MVAWWPSIPYRVITRNRLKYVNSEDEYIRGELGVDMTKQLQNLHELHI